LGPIGLCVAKWALIKGASRVIGVDNIPYRLAQAEEMGVDTVDFVIHSDVAKRVKELVPEGLDVAIDAATFHEPKTVMHKINKALALETDVSETLNETFLAVKKMGRVGIIAAYAGFTNGLNIGAVTEKGIRLIGNGQGKSKPCLAYRTNWRHNSTGQMRS
jgi:threonine dehydrogenase-like Zn-dependent dehydrogenase